MLCVLSGECFVSNTWSAKSGGCVYVQNVNNCLCLMSSKDNNQMKKKEAFINKR